MKIQLNCWREIVSTPKVLFQGFPLYLHLQKEKQMDPSFSLYTKNECISNDPVSIISYAYMETLEIGEGL